MSCKAISCLAGLLLLSALAPGAAKADAPLSLSSLSPTDTSAATGTARPVDLAGLDTALPSDAEALQLELEIYVGGFHLASVNLTASLDKGHYVAASLLSTKGLADAFVSSDIQAISTGEVEGHTVIPHTYNSDIKSSDHHQLVGLLFNSDGAVNVDSKPAYNLSRFPVSPELQRSTVDPLSAALFISLGSSADSSNKCGSTVPVFDGKRRYNLTLTYVGNDTISLGRDSFNEGKPIAAYLCRAAYSRVAGFKPPKPGHRETRVPPINVWLAPIPGTDLMLPLRMQASSDFGGIVARAVHVKVVPAGGHT